MHLSHQSVCVAIIQAAALWQCHISLRLSVVIKGPSAVPPFSVWKRERLFEFKWPDAVPPTEAATAKVLHAAILVL